MRNAGADAADDCRAIALAEENTRQQHAGSGEATGTSQFIIVGNRSLTVHTTSTHCRSGGCTLDLHQTTSVATPREPSVTNPRRADRLVSMSRCGNGCPHELDSSMWL